MASEDVKIGQGERGDVAWIRTPLIVEGDMQPPELIERVSPVYPEDAKRARVGGKVILEAVIDTDGFVTSTKVLMRRIPEYPSLEESAVAAVSQWRYKPATRDGKPVKVFFTVIIEFSLK